MSRRFQDIKTAALFSVVLLILILAITDPWNTASYSARSFGGLAIGVLSLGYAVRGFFKGRFPELPTASKSAGPLQFWFCFSVFVLMGVGSVWIGLGALSLAS